MGANSTPISKCTFDFLRQLARNNEREWFNANKQRYIDDVRDPLLAFIETHAGMWHPPSEALKQIRDAIVAKPKQWQKLISAKGCALDDSDRLSRPPRGYPADHRCVEDLKRKTFTTSREFPESAACAPGFVDVFAKTCREALPLVSFLAEAVELEV